MNKFRYMLAIILMAIFCPAMLVQAEGIKIKTRVDHLSGTTFVLVVSTLPEEITSITCDKWTMLGVGSWKDQNNFTVPGAGPNGVAIGLLNAKGFDGYCKGADSIKAHTDEGDFVGVLDRGAGNWEGSTKLTFTK